MEFSRQEGYLPNPGIKPRSPTLQVNSLPTEPQGKPMHDLKQNPYSLRGTFLYLPLRIACNINMTTESGPLWLKTDTLCDARRYTSNQPFKQLQKRWAPLCREIITLIFDSFMVSSHLSMGFCISKVLGIMSPFSFLILFIWVLSLFFLVILARGLSILFTLSKNQFLVLLIFFLLF